MDATARERLREIAQYLEGLADMLCPHTETEAEEVTDLGDQFRQYRGRCRACGKIVREPTVPTGGDFLRRAEAVYEAYRMSGEPTIINYIADALCAANGG